MTALLLVALFVRAHLPPAVVRCATSRPASVEVEVPAGARVVSAGMREDGRVWACWTQARKP